MNHKNIKKIVIVLVCSIPSISFAALDGINSLLVEVGKLVGAAIPITFSLGLVFFFWGVAKFILAAGNPAAKEKGRSIMIWGVIALFVMASVWGLVRFIGDTLGIQTGAGQNTQSSNSGGSFYCPPGDGCSTN